MNSDCWSTAEQTNSAASLHDATDKFLTKEDIQLLSEVLLADAPQQDYLLPEPPSPQLPAGLTTDCTFLRIRDQRMVQMNENLLRPLEEPIKVSVARPLRQPHSGNKHTVFLAMFMRKKQFEVKGKVVLHSFSCEFWRKNNPATNVICQASKIAAVSATEKDKSRFEPVTQK